ncbi:MAG TPA: DUF362 domain-containing protein, partial [Candidatus Deferrimicrobium sp.]|nr:DUF362 domain-containing protein [Candidatus Deferrimicrobium sp.]
MTKVAILQCSHYDQQQIRSALDRGITPLGGWNRYIKPGQKVLLKVNLIGPCPPSQAATTHPEVVRALIRICREHGCEVWVGDSAGGAIAGMAPTAKGMKVAGFEAVAQEEGAKIINFDKAGAVEIASKTGRFVNSFFIA